LIFGRPLTHTHARAETEREKEQLYIYTYKSESILLWSGERDIDEKNEKRKGFFVFGQTFLRISELGKGGRGRFKDRRQPRGRKYNNYNRIQYNSEHFSPHRPRFMHFSKTDINEIKCKSFKSFFGKNTVTT